MKKLFNIFLSLICFLLFSGTLSAQDNDGPEQVVDQLYELVTFKAEDTPDWDKVRELFIKDAVIVLRSSRDSSSILSLEGFVGDFVTFIEKSGVTKYGFTEKIIKKKPFVFGDIAHFLVVYEVSIPGTKFKPQLGVDSFQLIKTWKGWKIASIVNEVPSEGNPLPEGLK